MKKKNKTKESKMRFACSLFAVQHHKKTRR